MARITKYTTKLVREEVHNYNIGDSAGSPLEVVRIAQVVYEGADREQIAIFMLDRKNKVIGYDIVAVGILDSAPAHPREIFKSAILANASSIIMVHNHPSGDVIPSREDDDTTNRLADAGRLLGIELLDSIIINDEEGFYSYKGEGKLLWWHY